MHVCDFVMVRNEVKKNLPCAMCWLPVCKFYEKNLMKDLWSKRECEVSSSCFPGRKSVPGADVPGGEKLQKCKFLTLLIRASASIRFKIS